MCPSEPHDPAHSSADQVGANAAAQAGDFPQRYLVTAALPYANGPLHIGQIAGAYLPADIYVRYLRAMGRDVVFVCGSDEHGAAITLRARKEGIAPQEIIDRFHAINRDAFAGLGVDFDIYHRTSAALHHETAAAFFRTLDRKGVFEVQESEQYYDAEFGQFLADRYIMGTCPKCGNENAYGDQCERCGSTLSPTELINPRSTLSGAEPELRSTKHWYLPLNRYSDWLRSWILDGEGRREDWKRNVTGQIRSWIEDGLQPRAMTRDLDWGVAVPREDAEGKVLYVWLDAPVGYISATKQWAENSGRDWEPYWKDAGTKLLHFIGKDNIVFHGIIFPVILHAHGDYIVPTNVPANEFMNMEGDKLSTSRNWAVWIPEYLEQYPNQVDVLRYVLCANAPESKDSEFTWKDWQTRNNSELVATLGNFINRVLVLNAKYHEGLVPPADAGLSMASGENAEAQITMTETMDWVLQALDRVAEHVEAYRFREAQRAMLDIAAWGNAFLQFNAPWKQIKQDPEPVKTVLHTALQLCAVLSVAMEPFLPFSAAKLRGMLAMPPAERGAWYALREQLFKGRAPLEAGHALGTPELLFEKIDDAVVQKELDRLEAIKQANAGAAAGKGSVEPDAAASAEPSAGGGSTDGGSSEAGPATQAFPPVSAEIAYDDFAKLDLRVATIDTVERVPKADRLLKLELDLGFERRTVVSGIAEHFQPEDLPGTRVLYLANLAPRKLRGVVSSGMVLLSEDADGTLRFVRPEGEAPNGSPVR